MSKEAMKLALEALKMCRGLIRNNIENLVPIASPNPWFSQDVDHAITAIREALAEQPAQQRHISYACPQCHWSLEEQPAQQQEPVGTVQCINGVTIGYLDVMQPVGTKLYTAPQPAQPRKPLPFNKEDMEGLDVNQRLGFKLGWKSAEAAHNIKKNT